jgi:hypothetical protein
MVSRNRVLRDLANTLAASAIFQPAPSPTDDGPELPQVRAARERDRLARERIAAGADYKPTAAELVEARAWKRGRR